MDQSSAESIQASCRAVPAERKAEYVKFLRSAQDNIKQGWTQGAPARNDHGESVASVDAAACSFCLYGALWRIGLRPPDAVVSALYGALLKINPEKGEEIGLIGFAPEALAQLHGYDWPGNVRELRNVARRIADRGVPADAPLVVIVPPRVKIDTESINENGPEGPPYLNDYGYSKSRTAPEAFSCLDFRPYSTIIIAFSESPVTAKGLSNIGRSWHNDHLSISRMNAVRARWKRFGLICNVPKSLT